MLFVFASILIVAGPLAVIVNSLRNAPEGYQDEKGFHTSPANRPATAILRARSRERQESQVAVNSDVALNLRLRPAVGSIKN
jgi:hypothetical protein